jgi:hypothetical protein
MLKMEEKKKKSLEYSEIMCSKHNKVLTNACLDEKCKST